VCVCAYTLKLSPDEEIQSRVRKICYNSVQNILASHVLVFSLDINNCFIFVGLLLNGLDQLY
jgi:hypothetical protein